MNSHDIPPLALCPVNIRRGGGIRHLASINDRECYLCQEPIIVDASSGYWLRWVIFEQP